MTKEEASITPIELSVEVESSVAIFEIRGIATRASVIEALTPIYKASARHDVHAAVACYDQCEIRADMRDMLAIYESMKANGLPANIPVAIVVGTSLMHVMRDYCRHQGAAGVMRAVFDDRKTALLWVTEHAALHASITTPLKRA